MKYTWAVDGYGRQFIVDRSNDREIIFCVLACQSAKYCCLLLEDQDNEG